MMRKIYNTPPPSQAERDSANSIFSIIRQFQKRLPEYGYELTENPGKADLFIGHAGVSDPKHRLDVAVSHGLLPTARYPHDGWTWKANANVIRDLKRAARITVPSPWVADIIKRDMHVKPTVLPWAIDAAEWPVLPFAERHIGILWNKTRASGVCDPAPMNALAKRLPGVSFASTFGEHTQNVHITGKTPFPEMKFMIEHTQIYLATTRETFGIATLEAMAAGCPVLGFDWAGTGDIVTHKVDGYLVKPGDITGLVEGYNYIQHHWAEMSAAAREAVKVYSWDNTIQILANVLDGLPSPQYEHKVSVVIPCHNYEQYIGQALQSALGQVFTQPHEVIVVLDKSTDKSADIITDILAAKSDIHSTVLTTEYGNPADTRNEGIEASSGEYILCLDADDYLTHTKVLQNFADYLDQHPDTGLVYGRLQVINDAGEVVQAMSQWPGECDVVKQLQGHNQVPSCCMYRREAWARAGGYRRMFVPAEDAELWARMLRLGFACHLHPTNKPMVSYRMHDQSLSAPIRRQQKREPLWHSYLHNPEPFGSLLPAKHGTHPVRDYDQPLVSVIIPCGPGHQRYLFQALDSVEGQTDARWECIVANDSGVPLRDWLDEHGYPWVKLVQPQDMSQRMGPGAARNRAVTASVGRYLVFLDADDMLDPQFIAKCYKKFRETGHYVYTDWISWAVDGTVETHATPDYNPNTVFQKGAIHGITTLVPRTDFEHVGGFPEDMESWEDMEFFLRLAAAGLCGARVDEPLFIYRYMTGSMRERASQKPENLLRYIHSKYKTELGKSEGGQLACGCDKVKRVKKEPQPPSADLVRVEYSGKGVPQSPAPLRGVATRTNYRMKAAGDRFFVHKADYEAMPDKLHLIQEVEAEDYLPA